MRGWFKTSSSEGDRKPRTCLEEPTLGNVRTDQIKRTAKELVRRFPDKFSRDFEENKQLVATLTEGTTIKIRNQIAGYISHSLAAEEEEPVSETSTEEEKEENEQA